MSNGIRFAVTGNGTGLYLALSQYYESQPAQSLEVMREFGQFTVQGTGCYDSAHIVAKHTALNLLTDASLSNWSCSIHEAFTDYPQGHGTKDFKALAIALNATGRGSRKFPDGSYGIPYILATNLTAVDGRTCQLCIPYPGQNLCHQSTSCLATPYGTMCLTRPGYKADNATDDDMAVHWRMKWPDTGQEHRVAVAPGRSADTLCDPGNSGADVCKEVAVLDCAAQGAEDRRFVDEPYDNFQKPVRQEEI